MKLLFVHNNFPAQFRGLVETLVHMENVEIAAIGSETATSSLRVRLERYRMPPTVARAHSFARRFDNEARRAEQVLYAATSLTTEGFVPDVIFVHPGWGENLPLRTVFPSAKIVVYCEYYYRRFGGDIGFDPEFSTMGLDGFVGLDARNATTLLALSSCDAAISPTKWQKSTYPALFHPLISVIHEGIDTDFFVPDPRAIFELPDGKILAAGDEILTYAARNFEPMRGFHVFMRALPAVLERRPQARVVIAGGLGVSYGQPPRKHANWKEAMLAEVGNAIDPSRVTFLNRLPYTDYLKLLQVSAAHVYLTYPFVLSWSMLEAMSAGCLVIGSYTPPVREVINGYNGLLVPMFNRGTLVDTIVAALADPAACRPLREAARQTILRSYDTKTCCIPRQIELLEKLMGTTASNLAVAN